MYQTRIDNKQNMCSKGIRFILSNLSVFFSASQVSASHRHHPPSLIINHSHQLQALISMENGGKMFVQIDPVYHLHENP